MSASERVINYKFQWPAGPEDVILTGHFDQWKGSLPMVKNPETNAFELEVPLKFENEDKKIHFKFIVDGNWTVSHAYGKEVNEEGFENNFISLEDAQLQAQGLGNVSRIPEAGGMPVYQNSKNSSSSRVTGPPSTSNRKKGLSLIHI